MVKTKWDMNNTQVIVNGNLCSRVIKLVRALQKSIKILINCFFV